MHKKVSDIFNAGMSLGIRAQDSFYAIKRYIGNEFTMDQCITESEYHGIVLIMKEIAKYKTFARIFGDKEFYGAKYCLYSNVFEPRPETEILVESFIDFIGKYNTSKTKTFNLLECGVGTGCISISILKTFDNILGHGFDINPEAIKNSEQNAINHNVSDRAKFYLNSWDAASNLNVEFDFVISNPPYVTQQEYEDNYAQLQYDPRNACISGETGIECYEAIFKVASCVMKRGGILGFEIGMGQSEAIVKLARGFNLIEAVKDYSGIERCLFFVKGDKIHR